MEPSFPISAVQAGEELLAFTPEGQLVRTRVQSVLRRTVDEYVILKTDQQILRVTADHPFYIGDGRFKTLEALRAGDRIIAWDGQSLTGQQIVSIEKVRESTEVFNLQTDYPNTFFVDHLAVHNKGGGGGGGSSGGSSSHSSSSSSSGSGGSSEDSMVGFIVFFLVIVLIILILSRIMKQKENQNLDFVYDRNAITPKAAKTEKLLTFLSRQDPIGISRGVAKTG